MPTSWPHPFPQHRESPEEAGVVLLTVTHRRQCSTPVQRQPPYRFVLLQRPPAPRLVAVTNGDYFSFFITPADGYQLNLESITIDLSVNGFNTTSNTASYAFSSTVGGLGTLASNTVSRTAPNSSALSYTRNTFSFSHPEFANITSATEFRLFVSNSLVNDGAIARFDNIIINGSLTAVPEPSITMLGALRRAWPAASPPRLNRFSQAISMPVWRRLQPVFSFLPSR